MPSKCTMGNFAYIGLELGEGTLLWSETGTGKVMLILLVSIEVVDVLSPWEYGQPTIMVTD